MNPQRRLGAVAGKSVGKGTWPGRHSANSAPESTKALEVSGRLDVAEGPERHASTFILVLGIRLLPSKKPLFRKNYGLDMFGFETSASKEQYPISDVGFAGYRYARPRALDGAQRPRETRRLEPLKESDRTTGVSLAVR